MSISKERGQRLRGRLAMLGTCQHCHLLWVISICTGHLEALPCVTPSPALAPASTKGEQRQGFSWAVWDSQRFFFLLICPSPWSFARGYFKNINLEGIFPTVLLFVDILQWYSWHLRMQCLAPSFIILKIAMRQNKKTGLQNVLVANFKCRLKTWGWFINRRILDI